MKVPRNPVKIYPSTLAPIKPTTCNNWTGCRVNCINNKVWGSQEVVGKVKYVTAKLRLFKILCSKSILFILCLVSSTVCWWIVTSWLLWTLFRTLFCTLLNNPFGLYCDHSDHGSYPSWCAPVDLTSTILMFANIHSQKFHFLIFNL